MTLRSTEEAAQAGDAVEARQHELGQFFTDSSIADFMASLLTARDREIRLLDAGAGAGALSAAVVRRLCGQQRRPKLIEITAYELDPNALPKLGRTLKECAALCDEAGIQFSFTLHNADFIEATVPSVRVDLFAAPAQRFNVAIVNPPYRKIRGDSATRHLLSSAGIETTNLYTAFLSLIIRLLTPGGELVAITPRSFCNGPYFRPFREAFLGTMSLRRVHVFDSRSAAFRDDDVLQENIIFHAVKDNKPPKEIVVSTSSGERDVAPVCREVPFCDVVVPGDAERFIHLVTSSEDERVRTAVASFSTSLSQLGLTVSTGRVVDFRARAHLRQIPSTDTAPLIYPCHFNGGFVHWPKAGRKPNAIVSGPGTADLLVPAGIYVLVKRFTTKEEKRRIVACIYDPTRIRAQLVGFENHLNYFHADGEGLEMTLAKGLAAFLNSSITDNYFRQFNGHTQVNATDLRSLKYPTKQQLVALGSAVDVVTDAKEIDVFLERETNARA